ncbi:MAG: hypothetical protein O9350_16000 [Microcystis sp. LE19-388.1G]|nr:hypothetical protein [Microcystis sp. LE19-388.1G]
MDKGLLYLGDDKFPPNFDVEFRSEAIYSPLNNFDPTAQASLRFLSACASLFPDQLATPALILRTDNREICIKSYKYPKPDLPQAIALRKRVSLRNPFSGLKKVILDKIGGGGKI